MALILSDNFDRTGKLDGTTAQTGQLWSGDPDIVLDDGGLLVAQNAYNGYFGDIEAPLAQVPKAISFQLVRDGYGPGSATRDWGIFAGNVHLTLRRPEGNQPSELQFFDGTETKTIALAAPCEVGARLAKFTDDTERTEYLVNGVVVGATPAGAPSSDPTNPSVKLNLDFTSYYDTTYGKIDNLSVWSSPNDLATNVWVMDARQL